MTGLGMVTPLGNDVETSWANLIAGESGADDIKQFDASEFPVHFAAELKDFEPTDWMERKQARRMDRFAQMIVAASRQAESDSGIDIAKEADRIGASIATGIGGLGAFQDCYQTLIDRGPDRVNPFSITAIIPNMGAGWVSMELGTRGPLSSQCTACAASNMAIGEGADAIRLGRADAMICGGTEAGITRVGIAGFGAMRALSRRNDDPKRASRPFDAGRDGFVMGEAGGAVVLEELEHAKARGAKIYAELIGYGVSSDANHVTEPDPAGTNPARAMKMAFGDAGIDPSEIGYINAHGTSTPLGDTSETRVIKLALGEENARKTPVSSTKGATGHCLGAAGAVEAIFTILATQRGVLPPTINYEIEDPTCDLDYIPNESRKVRHHGRCLELVRLRRPQRLRRLPQARRVACEQPRRCYKARGAARAGRRRARRRPARRSARACRPRGTRARGATRGSPRSPETRPPAASRDRPRGRSRSAPREALGRRLARGPARRRRRSPRRRRGRRLGWSTERPRSSRPPRRRARRRSGARAGAGRPSPSMPGTVVSKVASPVAMPSAKIAATAGQSEGSSGRMSTT